MKKEWLKGIAAVLAVSMTVATIAACDRKKTEPPESLIPSETFVPATVQEMEDDELTALIKEVVGDDWNNDFSTLTEKQRSAIQQKLTEKGYHADVTENGIVYYSFTPTADEEEIAEVVKTVVGDESWTGSFTDLNDDDKEAVRDELRSRGYDVEIGEKGGLEFLGEAERKEQTTKYSYNLLPTQEQIIGAVADVIGSSAALKWDGSMLSLTEDQRNAVLKKLNDYGFDLALNEKGEFYMVHNPANKVTYESAYTPMEIEGTTRETTTVLTTAPEEPMFDAAQGVVLCRKCAGIAAGGLLPLDPGSLAAMRHVIGAEKKRMLSFSLNGETRKRFARACETFARVQLDRDFRTLDFYKSLRLPPDISGESAKSDNNRQ